MLNSVYSDANLTFSNKKSPQEAFIEEIGLLVAANAKDVADNNLLLTKNFLSEVLRCIKGKSNKDTQKELDRIIALLKP